MSTCTSCKNESIGSNSIKYDGPNLPCTNILTCEQLTVALQKIDEQICELKNTVISLQNQINELNS